jgi:hypothetical protein
VGGAAEKRVLLTGRRFAIGFRVAVLVALAVVAARVPAAVPVVVGLGVWNVVFVLVGPRRLAVAADVAVVCLLCVNQRWLVPGGTAESGNWVHAAASMTVVTHQWHVSATGGVALTAAVVAGQVVGAGWGAAPMALWTFVEAGMSRGVFALVLAGARSADRAVGLLGRARRDAEVAAARRADELEHLAVLHDTAAATLFVAGSGVARGGEAWLAELAARDIAALTATPPTGWVDVVPLLVEVARDSPVDVVAGAGPPSPEVRLPSTVAAAVCGAVREGLVNVGQHAGVDRAHLRVVAEGDKVCVEVVDGGRGFDTAEVPQHHRGITSSIVDRMARVGGRATVDTAPGKGTVVRLEWPGG